MQKGNSTTRSEHTDRISLHVAHDNLRTYVHAQRILRRHFDSSFFSKKKRNEPDRPDRGWSHVQNTSRNWKIGGGVVALVAGGVHVVPVPSASPLLSTSLWRGPGSVVYSLVTMMSDTAHENKK